MTPTFQKIPLKKEGNKDVFGNIDFGSHETVACRSVLLIQRILRNVLKKNPRPFWITRLKVFCSNFHAHVFPYLNPLVGYKATTGLFIDLCQVQTHLVTLEGLPPFLNNKVDGFIRKTSRLHKERTHSDWVEAVKEMLDKNLSGAHKFCNSHNAPTKLVTVTHEGFISTRGAVESTSLEWEGVWGGSPEEARDYSKCVQEIREKALPLNKPYSFWRAKVNPRTIKAVAKTFKDNSSSDQLSTKLITQLPDCILEEFSSVFIFVLQQASLPTSCFEVFLFLLPKKLGGFRTIGMFPTFYRILMKLISDEFREWDGIHANTHDTAQKGLESEFELYKNKLSSKLQRPKA